MPLRYSRSRHGSMLSTSAKLFLVVALVAMTTTHAAQNTVVSNVRPASIGDDVASDADAASTTKERAFSFQDALSNTWDALTARTLRPSTGPTSANEADKNSGDDSSTAGPTVKPAAPIKVDPHAQSADDAVNVALKTPAPAPTEPATLAPPATFAPSVVVTIAPVTPSLPVVTPSPTPTMTLAPPVDSSTPAAPSATPATAPGAAPLTPRSTAATASSPHAATTSDSSSSRSGATHPATPQPSTRASAPSKGGNLDSEELTKSASVRSGLSSSGFDELIVVIVLGGVGAIAVVVYVMSRKIAKETGDDAAMRETSSFAHL